MVENLETGEQRVLVQRSSFARYSPTGHLVYSPPQSATLMAMPFDLERLEVTGDPFPALVEGVMQSTASGISQFGFSSLGTLVFVPGGMQEAARTLVWVDRQGAAEPLAAPKRNYLRGSISPDGQRVAVDIQGANVDVWVYDIPRSTLTRLTFEGSNARPIWTPDGKRVTFDSDRAGPLNLFWKSVDGNGPAERLTTSEHRQFARSWSPDGQVLAIQQNHPTNEFDLWLLPLDDKHKPRSFLETPFYEGGPVFSPDGRWLAYGSDESGRLQVYVQSFPGPGRKWQISSEGGAEPVWARNGRELFYRNGDQMMAVDITTEPFFSAGNPRLLFEGEYLRPVRSLALYDVAPDGQRFLMVQESEQESAAGQINVVLNWFTDLKSRMPSNQ